MADDLAARATAGMAQLIAARTTLMLDACQVTRPAGLGQTPALDGDGNLAGAGSTVVYFGPCTLADPKLPPLRHRTVQDDPASPEQRELRVPHGADLRVGDVVTVTAAAFSPGLVGDVFAVVREDERTYATMRRYILRGSAWEQ